MEDDLARIEGWLRVLVGSWLVAFAVVEVTSGWLRVAYLAATMSQTVVLGGLMVVLGTRRHHLSALVWRLSFAVDAVLLSVLAIAATDVGQNAAAMTLLLPVPVLGAIRYRTAGGVVGAVVATATLLVQYEVGHDAEATLLAVLVGGLATLGMGLLVGMVVGLTHDRELHLQAALADERELAQGHRRLDQMRRDVMAITGHELRSPLTSIRGTVLLLQTRRDQLSRQQVDDFLRALVRQADRVLGLVDDLDSVTRGDGARDRIAVGPVAMTEVVEHVREVLPEVAFEVLGRADTVVLADASRLEQVLINLLRNAAEHGDGTITLSWSAEQDRRRSRIQVSDEGPGVPADLRRTMFDRYVSGRREDSGAKGCGLGLSISRELTEAMGGTLDLLETSAGAVFSVTLRLAAGSPAGRPRRAQPDVAGRTA